MSTVCFVVVISLFVLLLLFVFWGGAEKMFKDSLALVCYILHNVTNSFV